MSAGQAIIEERAKIRGDFRDQAATSQFLKAAIHAAPNWNQKLDPWQKEVLEHIQEKIARILTGDPNEKDAWLDISGYATLIHNILTKGTPT